MEYQYLGKSDLYVSRICLGMMSFGSPSWRPWVLSEEKSYPCIAKALSLGINFFDTANVYSYGASEMILGKAVRQYATREKVVIATKGFYPMPGLEKGLSRAKIRMAVHGSLERLQTDYIDLYQIHRWDYETPIEETLSALHELVEEGKIRYLGASSMYAWQFAKANYLAKHLGKTPFITMQNHYNLIFREEEREMIPLCQDLGIAILPWSPLARGFLTKTRKSHMQSPSERMRTDLQISRMYLEENDFAVLDRLEKIAEEKGVTLAQLALSWLLHKPFVAAPILGMTREEHLLEALSSLNVRLSSEEIERLEALYKTHPILTFDMERKMIV